MTDDVDQPTRCGAPVIRCTGCENTVAASLDECPRCNGHDFADSTCRKVPLKGMARCGTHGGRNHTARTRAAAKSLEAEARAELARLGQPKPIGHPFRELVDLASERKAYLAFLRARLQELDSLESVDDFGIERTRALITLYTSALDGSQRSLEGLARLGLDAQLVRLEEAQARLAFTAIRRALRSVLEPSKVEEVQRAVLVEMQAVTAPTALPAGDDKEAVDELVR